MHLITDLHRAEQAEREKVVAVVYSTDNWSELDLEVMCLGSEDGKVVSRIYGTLIVSKYDVSSCYDE